MVQKTWNWLLLWCWLCQQSLLNLCTTYIRSHFMKWVYMKSKRGISKPHYYTTSPHFCLRWAAASWEKCSVGIWPSLCRVLPVKHSSKGRWRAAAQRTCVISNWRLQRKHLTHGSSSFLSFTMETQWKNTRYKWPFLNKTQDFETEDFVPVTSDII